MKRNSPEEAISLVSLSSFTGRDAILILIDSTNLSKLWVYLFFNFIFQ